MLILSVFCYIIRAINYVFVVLKVMLYMSDRLIDNKELMKEWNQEKNILYNPADLTSGSSKKVWWKCKNGHEWEAVIHTRVKGVGCPYCMGKKAIQGVNDFATLYPEMLKEWDYEENDKLGIKPNELLVGSIKKVYWICSKGHKYDRSIYDRLHGRGNCPYCGNRKVLQGYNDLATTNPELLKDWDYEENDKLGIKPNEITNGGKEKVWWKCEKGHNYQAIVSNKVNQQTKCPYCANKKIIIGFNDLATTNPELLEEWDYEKNDKLGIKPENVVLNSTKMIHWKCKNGHEWTTTLNNRARGSNCPYCSGRYAISGENDIATLFPELLKEWDYEKNDQLGIKPQNVKKNTDKKVWWKCEKGHEYKSSIVNRTKSKGTCCPYCSGNKVLKGFNDIASTNPELLKEWDYSKNTIKPDEVTKGTHKKIWWICSNNHSYEATIPARRRGTGCPYCSGNKILVGFNDLATTNPELSEKWNYEKNNKLGITPKSISKSYSKKVWWKCKQCGNEWEATVISRNNGRGCPACAEKSRAAARQRKLLSKKQPITMTHPELMQDWDYEENSNLNPDFLTAGSGKRAGWKCHLCETKWTAVIVERTRGKGKCPKCSKH